MFYLHFFVCALEVSLHASKVLSQLYLSLIQGLKTLRLLLEHRGHLLLYLLSEDVQAEVLELCLLPSLVLVKPFLSVIKNDFSNLVLLKAFDAHRNM